MLRTSASFASFASAAFGLVTAVLGLGREPGGCSGGGESEGIVNAPCTRDKDCRRALSCVEGVCTSPDAPPAPADGGRVEGEGDAAAEAGP